jgi:hypothetical protein
MLLACPKMMSFNNNNNTATGPEHGKNMPKKRVHSLVFIIFYNRLARMVLQWELKGRERQKILISLRDMTQFTLVPCSSSHQNSWNVWMLNPQKTWKTIGFKPSPYPHVVPKFLT